MKKHIKPASVSRPAESTPRTPTRLEAVAARDGAIVAFYFEGHTLKATGEKFGLTRERVRQIVRASGYATRRSTPKLKSPKKRRLTTKERILTKAEEVPSGCLLWKGWTYAGYPKMRYGGKSDYAHRVRWKLTKGEIRGELINQCGSTLCVNLGHWKDEPKGSRLIKAQNNSPIIQRHRAKNKRKSAVN